jgi:hypothetical protein
MGKTHPNTWCYSSGIVAAILKPFMLIGSFLGGVFALFKKIPIINKGFRKIIIWFERIITWFEKLPGVGKLLSGAGKAGKFFKSIGKFFAWIFSKIPFVTSFIKGFRIGFKLLGWPIQIIFMIIDFIRGFVKEYGKSGDIMKSIGAGFKQVLIGFINLPVKLIGWIIDMVLKWFGIEGADSAKKIMGWISKLFDIMWPFAKYFIFWPYYLMKSIYDLIAPFMKKHWPKIKEYLSNVFDAIKTIFTALWKGISGFFSWWRGKGESGEPEKPPKPKTKKELTSAVELAEEERKKYEKMSKSAKNEQEKKYFEKLASDAEKQAQEYKAMLISAQTNTSDKGGEQTPQIPDDIENSGIISKNYDLELMF